MSAPKGEYPSQAIIDFRHSGALQESEFRLPDLFMKEADTMLEASPDIANYSWNAPKIICIQADGTRSVRQTHICANLTSGTRIIIEILPKSAIDETVIAVSRILARSLPFFGNRYMVVFPCQFKKHISRRYES
jgi:hypothetical protein